MARPSITKTLQIVAKERSEIVELPLPDLEPGQVLVKNLAIVTCNQYDLHIFTGRPMLDPMTPVTFPQPAGFPGHEWVGEVVELGSGVTELALGDWVCRPGGLGTGACYPAGYSQYLVCPESILLRVPNDMDPLKLAPMEMASCVAANVVELRQYNAIEGRRAGVSGLGPAGLIAAQMLRAEGAEEVVGIEVDAQRAEYALSLGVVDRVVDPDGDSGDELPYARQTGAIEVSLACAGYRPAVQYLMDHTTEIVSLFAVQREPYSYEGWAVGHHMGLKVFGTPDRDELSGPYAARRVRNGSLDLSVTISHTMSLTEYDEALRMIADHEAMKVAFLPQELG